MPLNIPQPSKPYNLRECILCIQVFPNMYSGLLIQYKYIRPTNTICSGLLFNVTLLTLLYIQAYFTIFAGILYYVFRSTLIYFQAYFTCNGDALAKSIKHTEQVNWLGKKTHFRPTTKVGGGGGSWNNQNFCLYVSYIFNKT